MKDAEEWLKALSDEGRAEVLKVKIHEEETTKRKEIEEQEATKRARFSTEGFHVVRGLIVVGIVTICLMASAVSCEHIKSIQVIKEAELAAQQKAAPAATASAEVPK